MRVVQVLAEAFCNPPLPYILKKHFKLRLLIVAELEKKNSNKLHEQVNFPVQKSPSAENIVASQTIKKVKEPIMRIALLLQIILADSNCKTGNCFPNH